MRTPDGDKILELLRTHQGRDTAITSIQIARALGWKASAERRVREIIATEWRSWPEVMLCSLAGLNGGFYLADEVEQIQDYRLSAFAAAYTAVAKLKAIEAKAAALGVQLPPLSQSVEELENRMKEAA